METFLIFRIIGWFFIISSIIGVLSQILLIDAEREPLSRTDVVVKLILTIPLIWFLYTAMQI